ncbi:MAG: tetratricopeptide repeat protein [Kiritimatiellae bacterium]|nr:tetratricopeptide repeat protein [Kiritimatiellia bacterium]
MLSCKTVVEHLGLAPFPPMQHPVWGFVLRSLDALPVGLAPAAHLFNALCMGVASGLLCSLMQAWRWDTLPEKYRCNRHEQGLSLFTGMLASVIFTLTLPAWLAGTRAMPLSMGVAGILILFRLLLAFSRHSSRWLAALISLLWGVGIVEYGSFAVLLPVVGILFLLLLWRADMLRMKMLLLLALCGLAGLSLYLWESLAYMRSPAYGWREFEGLHQVLWYLWREQYLELKAGMVSAGWLLAFTMLIVPWITLLFLPLTQRRKSRFQAPSWFLFLVFGLMAVVVLLNLPPAPWVFSGVYPLLVLPYLFFSSWVARLVGTVFFALTSGRPDAPGLSVPRRAMVVVAGAALISFLGVTAARNYAIVQPAASNQIYELGCGMAEPLPDGSYVIANGLLDHTIILAAHKSGKTIHLINLPYCISKSYRRYVGSLFDDPRLQNLAGIGWQPFMQEWSRRDTEFGRRVHILQPPDLWSRLGYTPVPNPVLYAGMNEESPMDGDTLKGSAAYCLNLATNWTAALPESNLGLAWYNAVQTLLSQVCNNLGVVLEDHELADDADALYQASLRLDEQNICALMNRISLLRTHDDVAAGELQKQLDERVAARKQRFSFWQLSSRYGYIRNPGFYMAQGYAWAISGKPSAAIREVQRAIDLSGETPAMKTLLAHLYVNASEPEEGEKLYKSLLDEDPANTRALAGLAHLALARQDAEGARLYLDRLRELDVPEADGLEEAIVAVMSAYSDDYAETRDLLKGLLKKNPGNVRLWATLALLAGENEDESTTREAEGVLENAVQDNPMLALALAQLNLRSGNYTQAKLNLVRAIRFRPGEIRLHEQYLQLLVNMRLRDEAEEECRVILELNTDNALANYVIGTIQASRGEEALAENSYRTSLAVKRSPLVLNDLAWLLAGKGRADQAETLAYAEEALRLDPENPNTMDTYGYILMKQNRLAESEQQLRRALSSQPDNPVLLLHLAELYEKQGQNEAARQLAEPLLQRMSELSPAEYVTLREMVFRIRTAQKNMPEDV